jgi:hypothetical protein
MEAMQRILIEQDLVLTRIPLHLKRIVPVDISHDGKSEHSIIISFNITEKSESSDTIDFYILTAKQYDNWIISATNPGTADPPNYTHIIRKSPMLQNYTLPISQTGRWYFLVENSGMTISRIVVNLLVKETWIPNLDKPIIYTTLSVTDNSLSKKIKDLIRESKINLKIISPFTDLYLIEEISGVIEKGVEVSLIMRGNDRLNTHDTKTAFPHLQKLLKKNLKINERIHARIIIKDDREALIMSSDLTQDGMQNLINCGILITDTSVIADLLIFFNNIWNASKNAG